MKEFLQILKHEAKEIEIKFERSSIEGKGTSQEVSDFREHAVQSFLEKYFPFPYRIAKGGIYDNTGLRSDSIDCIILNPVHPYTVNTHGKHSLILADGVDIAIEVKPDIAVNKELVRGLIQGVSVKKLRRVKSALLNSLGKPHSDEIIEMSKQVPYFIFSMNAKKEISKTIEEIKKYYAEQNTPIENQIDGIVIQNRGIIMNYKHKDLIPWGIKSDEVLISGWIFEKWGEDTLAGFLSQINMTFPSVPYMSSPVIGHYLNSFQIELEFY